MKPIEGRYYSNGDKNLYMKIIGEGSPAVVFEPGLGSLSLEWESIQQEIAGKTTAITYDRAGYAESPNGESPRTGPKIAMELYNALKNAGIKGPYILVGNSIGGLYAIHFAKIFPRDTAGLVLADSITPGEKQFEELDVPEYNEKFSLKSRIENIKKLTELEKEDFEKSISAALHDIYNTLPKEFAEKMAIYQADKKFYQAVIDEYEGMDASLDAFNSIEGFPNIPMKALCRDFEVMLSLGRQIGIPDEEARAIEEHWLKSSKELAGLSSEGEFLIVKGSNHSMHLSRPDIVLEQTLDLLESVRTGQ